MNIYPNKIIPTQLDNTPVAIDTEFFGMNEKRLHRPSGTFAAMTMAVGDDVYIILSEKDIKACLDNISNCIWIMHNAKFDITQLRRYTVIWPRKKIWDTMLIERILYGGYYDGFSLADLARRYCEIELEKDMQKEFGNLTQMTQEAIQYACLDAWATLQVYNEQVKRMDRNDFRIWTEVDRPALWAVLDFQGFRIDVDGWLELARSNRARVAEIDDQLDFNPRSPAQVKKTLQAKGFKGLKATGEDELEKAINKYPNTEAARLARLVLDSRMYAKRAGTYGERLIQDFVEHENYVVPMIIANYKITGAESGRMACDSPNMQNIPARDTKEYREKFIARSGHKLVILDYSAQEPCITAFVTHDKKLIQTFNDGLDVYCEMYFELKKEKITKKDKDKRSRMKPVFLGATYGLSKYGLAKKENIPLDEAEELLTTFFKEHPGVANWVRRQQKPRKYVTTVMGRKSWLNPYTNQSERNALNAPIQGSAGDMLKMSLGRLHQQWDDNFPGRPFGVVAVVHDEIVLDVWEDDAEEVGKLASKIMVDVGEEMLGHQIPMKADYFVCDNWSQKG